MSQIIQTPPPPMIFPSSAQVPKLFTDAGERATNRFLEFFAANIRNAGTRIA